MGTSTLSRRSFAAGVAAASAALVATGATGMGVSAAQADEVSTGAMDTAASVAPRGGAQDTSVPANFGAASVTDSELGGVATFSGGNRRPAPHTGHPTFMTSGHVGPDAEPIAPVAAPDVWDAEADVVVVGAGYGGLTAACYAAQNGCTAILCEKNPETGGASAHSAFNASIVGGTRRQIANGYFFASDTFDFPRKPRMSILGDRRT